MLATGAGALSDDSVRAAFGVVADLAREVQKLEAVLAGVIAQRSRRDTGHAGLAQVGGFRTPVQMVQEITGVSRAEATRVVKVGQALADVARSADRPASESEWPVHWHEPLGAALLVGTVTRSGRRHPTRARRATRDRRARRRRRGGGVARGSGATNR